MSKLKVFLVLSLSILLSFTFIISTKADNVNVNNWWTMKNLTNVDVAPFIGKTYYINGMFERTQQNTISYSSYPNGTTQTYSYFFDNLIGFSIKQYLNENDGIGSYEINALYSYVNYDYTIKYDGEYTIFRWEANTNTYYQPNQEYNGFYINGVFWLENYDTNDGDNQSLGDFLNMLGYFGYERNVVDQSFTDLMYAYIDIIPNTIKSLTSFEILGITLFAIIGTFILVMFVIKLIKR